MNLFSSAKNDDSTKPIIKAFHSWTIQWDSGGLSSMGKGLRALVNPTTPIKWYDERLITCEVHRIPPIAKGGMEAEKVVIRVMVKTKKGRSTRDEEDGGDDDESDVLSEDEDDDNEGEESDDESIGAGQMYRTEKGEKIYHYDSLGPLSGFVADRVDGYEISESHGGGSNIVPSGSEWKSRKQTSLGLSRFNIVGQTKKKVLCSFGLGKQIKTLKFNSEEEATGFVALVAHLRAGRSKRMQLRKNAFINSLIIEDEDMKVDILIEVVSCFGLMAADVRTSDPYVKCSFNEKEVHRTQYQSSTLDPIFTVKTGSLFILSLSIKELFNAREGLKLEVKDYDAVGTNEALGEAIVAPRALFDGNGERLVLPLVPRVGQSFAKGGNGHIAVRYRKASDEDLDFMNRLSGGIKNIGNASPLALSSEGAKSPLKSLATVNKKNANKEKVYRVKPHSDPSRKDETKYLTSAQIQEESLKRSQTWIDAGTGTIGRVYLEILACDGLPSLDRVHGVGFGSIDPFVMVVFEDCALKTDIIDNCKHPRWLPWSKRAFMLRRMHSSSQLFLGIFDYNSAGHHDRVGRVVIDLSTLRPNTEYMLTYNIYNKTKISKRKPRGSITVRICIDHESERELITSALSFNKRGLLTTDYYVNVAQPTDFYSLHYTASGKYGPERYGMNEINNYVDELLTSKRALYYLWELSVQIMFWRGHFPLNLYVPRFCPFKYIEELGGRGCIRKVTIKLPLRSLVVFLFAIHLVENPDDIPSFFFATIAYIMFVSLAFRRKNPNKLTKPQPYFYYLRVLLFGSANSSPLSIAPYENAEEIEAFTSNLEAKAAKFEAEAEKTRLENEKKQLEHQKEMEEIGLAAVMDIGTQTGGGLTSGVSFDPLKGLFMQIQTILELCVTIMRFSRSVILWDEPFLAFLLTTASMLLAIACISIPWGQVIHWICRIVVWTFLGPWMKLVDILWHSHVKHWIEKLNRFLEEQQREALELQKTQARITKENRLKFKAMKEAMFGKLISKVSVYHTERCRDIPLPASEARPLPTKSLLRERASWTIQRVHGQHLTGNMIPRIDDPIEESDKAVDFSSSKRRHSSNGENIYSDSKTSVDDDERRKKQGEQQPLLNGGENADDNEKHHHWYTIKNPLAKTHEE